MWVYLIYFGVGGFELRVGRILSGDCISYNRNMNNINRVAHFEIHATDTAKMADFYKSVFGWEVKKWDNPAMDYWIVMTGKTEEPGGINGGIVGRKGPKPVGGEPVNAYVCTIQVASLEETLKKVLAANGSIALPKMAIPGFAWLMYCKDIEGNIFGMIEDDKTAK